MADQLHVPWRLVHERAEEVADSVASATITAVSGIPRGGLIPAAIIAERLHLPLVGIDEPVVWPNRRLVVDDLIDSGSTARRYAEHGPLVALYRKPWSPSGLGGPSCVTVDAWVVFPWEADADEVPAADAVLRLLQAQGVDTTGAEADAAELVTELGEHAVALLAARRS